MLNHTRVNKWQTRGWKHVSSPCKLQLNPDFITNHKIKTCVTILMIQKQKRRNESRNPQKPESTASQRDWSMETRSKQRQEALVVKTHCFNKAEKSFRPPEQDGETSMNRLKAGGYKQTLGRQHMSCTCRRRQSQENAHEDMWSWCWRQCCVGGWLGDAGEDGGGGDRKIPLTSSKQALTATYEIEKKRVLKRRR